MRIGHGYDVHAFTGPQGENGASSIVIGGVTIMAARALAAHSDGDVLLHAICDALLGAAGLGDIGRHFPDTDPQFANADSRGLLRTVVANLHDRGLMVVNIDSTIVAQTPKMAPHVLQMQRAIADDCGIDASCVNVKATTTEKLGFTGREEGIACHAVALIDTVS